MFNIDDVGVVEVLCKDSPDCEHNKDFFCCNAGIEVTKSGCMSFSRRSNWREIIK